MSSTRCKKLEIYNQRSNWLLFTRLLNKIAPQATIPVSLAGEGLIRSKFSPVLERGVVFIPQRQDYYSVQWNPSATFIGLTANRYCTFEQNPNTTTFATFNNTFLNLSLGNRVNTSLRSNLLLGEYEVGIGYLVEREGSYYGKNTFKVFGSVVTRSKFIRLTPKIYITDNSKRLSRLRGEAIFHY